MTLSTGKPNDAASGARAFTLVELILVMALLVVCVSLVTPTLSRFFSGRSADSEVKRFLALMHYGQSRAVSEGIPMMLWIDPVKGAYGLEQESGYADKDQKAVNYTVAEGLRIDILKAAGKTAVGNSQTGRILLGQTASGSNRKLPSIYFSPDGTILSATSVSGVAIIEGNKPPVYLGPSIDRLNYEVQDKNTILANARR